MKVPVTLKSGQVIKVLPEEVAGLKKGGFLKEEKAVSETKEEKVRGRTKAEKK